MNFYITFPQRLADRKDKYVKIEAHSYQAARSEAFRRFRQEWAFVYPERAFEGQIAAYGLTELNE